jgi:hypothetical protein
MALLLVAAACLQGAARGLEIERHADRLQITAGGRPIATYVFNDAEILRPYFAQLHTPGGTQVTRNHPPIEGQDDTDHAAMHPGLWLGFGDLSGADFWRNRAAVRHVRFVDEPAIDRQGAGFTVENAYLSGEQKLCDEICRIQIAARPEGYLITWDSTFRGAAAFAFGDQEEMGLGVRVATPLAVKHGGRIVNSDRQRNESQVWGKPADWCDYSGAIGGRMAGLLLMPDPKNFRRSWFHARDYGVLVANPFGQNAFTKGAKSQVVVRPGESLRLRFGILAHEGTIDPAAAYADWVRALAANE